MSDTAIEGDMIRAHKAGGRFYNLFGKDQEGAERYARVAFSTDREREAFMAGFTGSCRRNKT